MDVDKVLVTNQGEFFLNGASLKLVSKRIDAHYKTNPTEKLVHVTPDSNQRFEVYRSKGEGIIVTEIKEVGNDTSRQHINGLRVTFRKQGDIRIDDPNQEQIAPAGILHTYYGICDSEGTITFYTNNEKASNPTHLNNLLNINKYHGLDTREIANRYRDAVSSALQVLKNLPQT